MDTYLLGGLASGLVLTVLGVRFIKNVVVVAVLAVVLSLVLTTVFTSSFDTNNLLGAVVGAVLGVVALKKLPALSGKK